MGVLLESRRGYNDFFTNELVLNRLGTEGVAIALALSATGFTCRTTVLHQATNARPSIRQAIPSSKDFKQVRHVRCVSRILLDFLTDGCNVRKFILIIDFTLFSIEWQCNFPSFRKCVWQHRMIIHENQLIIIYIIRMTTISILGCLDSIVGQK